MDYTQDIMPELTILIPVLVIIGKLLKDSSIADKHIPVILGIISMIISCIWVVVNTSRNIPQAVLTGIVQGILIAGAAVYGNQIYKQYKKNDMQNKKAVPKPFGS